MFKVQLMSSKGFNSLQKELMANAINKFEQVMNTEALKQEIINFSCSLGDRFENNAGMTNQQVYEKIMTAAEEYKPDQDYTANLHLVLVRKRKPWFTRYPAIGYGRPGQAKIYTYTWWFNQAKDYEYAGHIAHEWAHKIGFDHSFKPTKTRRFSVPYALGDIVEKLARDIS